MTETTALTTIDPIRRALAEAASFGDLKSVRDMARAARAWAKARGLGVESENDATEYVFRSERGLGVLLSDLEKKGLYGMGAVQRGAKHTVRKGPVTDRVEGVVTNAELGLRPQDAINCRLSAAMPDEEFEDLLRRARLPDKDGRVRRLSKLDFYKRDHKAPKTRSRETPENTGFIQFRDGVRSLLGWQDDAFTSNGLLTLPDDELVQIAECVKALIAAYQTAKAARHG